MQKIAVISTNNNPDYKFYAPFAEYAWNKLGWQLAIVCTHDVDHGSLITNNPDTIRIQLPEIKGVRTATMAQAGRLYACNTLPHDSLVMTCDIDLLPITDYWQPDPNHITVYGHDLTDYTYYPMGYVAMTCAKWMEAMGLTYDTEKDMDRDFQLTKAAYAEDWETWWNVDWDLLTKRLQPHKDGIRFVKRGRRYDGSGFAHGRIDRGDSMKMIEPPYIDMHCENNNVLHPVKYNKFVDIYRTLIGELPNHDRPTT